MPVVRRAKAPQRAGAFSMRLPPKRREVETRMQPFKRESGDSPSVSAKQAFIGRLTKDLL
jgi:hypothetical protein